MTAKLYQFTAEGSAADEQTWAVTDQITCEFNLLWDLIMQKMFWELTMGRAVFGKPGVGCKGPYDIHKLTIEQVKQ